MIEQLPKHEDEWAYYESEPLFDYVCQVSEETVIDINPDGSPASTTPHLQPFRFASDYLNGKIDTEEIKMDLYESSDIQDTLKAFGLDSSKFWYLCLFIKWRVDHECKTAFVFPKSTKEKLQGLINEFEKISPELIDGKFISKVPATLTFKAEGGKTVTIDDGHTLTIIGAAIESYMEQMGEAFFIPQRHKLSDLEKVDISTRTKIYLFNEYLSPFVKPLKADKKINVSKDKSLLISRMIYIFGVCDDMKLYIDRNDKTYSKQNQLKGYLSRYKPVIFSHF